ncbi:Hypothetical protein IALB_1267 [Ignavibacterium album JCM 16511]|uniref:Glucosyl transferase n=1 Tax=Ignavibacterium album (strain DSM 19864 / JCM 16511 / NBRC 101810 / Mat9-16) TaxID=945713 RepID=I0AJ20_IGNAJ|nr:hypothetical protein [Ignavibacterium album]AFH48977.1 Hypothetical protein IALB_1267 [Ignavibacterium album JCM 16511]
MLINYKSINQSIIHSIIQPFIHSITQPFLRSVVLFLFLSMTILLFGCKQTTEPKLEPELKLELEDVSCTEAWINLRITNLQLPANVTLYKNSVAQNNILCYGDTLLYVDSLLPNQTYKFKSIVQSSNQQIITSSNELTVTTMDTTSHEFTWQSWEFGQHSSSTLYDVAIIDENNIWAVGEIYMNDSLGRPDPNAYNAVHWDGTKWELKRIPIYLPSGYPFYPEIKSVFAFNSNDIWFEAGIHWDGNSFKQIPFNIQWSGNVNKLWGSSSSDLYAVGNNGNIAHWDGRKWTKIESGTTLNINDIWGDYNEKTGQWEILAVAANYGSNLEKEILLLENNHIQKLSTESNPLMEPLLTTWFVPNRQYYVAGAGIYQKHLLKDSKWKNNLFNITTFATTSIRGNNINDIIGVGAFGDFVHFNGINWKNNYAQPSLSNGSYSKVALKGNLIVAVGGNYTSINSVAVILLGRR